MKNVTDESWEKKVTDESWEKKKVLQQNSNKPPKEKEKLILPKQKCNFESRNKNAATFVEWYSVVALVIMMKCANINTILNDYATVKIQWGHANT